MTNDNVQLNWTSQLWFPVCPFMDLDLFIGLQQIGEIFIILCLWTPIKLL